MERPEAARVGIVLGLVVLMAGGCLAAMSEEADMSSATVSTASAPQYPPYNGCGFEQVRGEKTGFFHTEKQGDTWWLIDPNGLGFLICGVEHIDNYYPVEYESEEAWARPTAERLLSWSFNALGWTWSNPVSIHHRGLAHTIHVDVGDFVVKENITPVVTWEGFPNVFSPDWPAYCDEQARTLCAPHRDDPWLIGYFLDNELQWYGPMETWLGEFGLAIETWKKPADHSAKKALLGIVRKHCPTIEDFNRAWETQYTSFEELAASAEPHDPPGDEAKAMAREYVRLVAERYFSVATAAIRRHDPNHMILGCRFAFIAPGIWDIAGKYCDVVSVNYYPTVDPDRGVPRGIVKSFQDYYAQSGKPLYVTEWSFSAPLGETAANPSSVFTQQQRAASAASFERTLLSLPFMVGSNWYLSVDLAHGAPSGHPWIENSGLFNLRGEPYEELTTALADVNRRACEIHIAGVLDDVYDPPPPVNWSRSLPEAVAELTGDPLLLASGSLELIQGENGGWEVKCAGHLVNVWRPILWQDWSPETGIGPSTCSVVDVRQDEQFTVVDVEFAGQDGEGVAFKAGWRLWLPRRLLGWCALQSLYVENSGSSVLDTSCLMHWTHRAGADEGVASVASRINVPGLYMPLAAAELPEAGVGMGVTTFGTGVDFQYDAQEDGPYVSRCRQVVSTQIEPGQRHAVDGPTVVLFAYEGEGTSDLYTALQERTEAVRAEVSAFCAP